MESETTMTARAAATAKRADAGTGKLPDAMTVPTNEYLMTFLPYLQGLLPLGEQRDRQQNRDELTKAERARARRFLVQAGRYLPPPVDDDDEPAGDDGDTE